MEIVIHTTANEIADLVLALQGRRDADDLASKVNEALQERIKQAEITRQGVWPQTG